MPRMAMNDYSRPVPPSSSNDFSLGDFDSGLYYSADSSSTSSAGRISESPMSNLVPIGRFCFSPSNGHTTDLCTSHLGPQTPLQQQPYSSFDYVSGSSTAVTPDPYVQDFASLLHPSGFSPFLGHTQDEAKVLQRPSSACSPSYSPYGQALDQHHQQRKSSLLTAPSASASTSAPTTATSRSPSTAGVDSRHQFEFSHHAESPLGLHLNTADIPTGSDITPMASAGPSNPASFQTSQQRLIAYYFEKKVYSFHSALGSSSDIQEGLNVLHEIIIAEPGKLLLGLFFPVPC